MTSFEAIKLLDSELCLGYVYVQHKVWRQDVWGYKGALELKDWS